MHIISSNIETHSAKADYETSSWNFEIFGGSKRQVRSPYDHSTSSKAVD